MATLAQIHRDPSTYLGVGDERNPDQDQEYYAMFLDAVTVLMERGDDEQDAIDRVWGNGNYIPRAIAILEG